MQKLVQNKDLVHSEEAHHDVTASNSKKTSVKNPSPCLSLCVILYIDVEYFKVRT